MTALFKSNKYVLFAVWATVTMSVSANDFSLISPDEQIGVDITNEGGQLLYSISRDGEMLVKPSNIGLRLEGESGKIPLKIKQSKHQSLDETWSPVGGKRAQVRNHYNELILSVSVESPATERMNVLFRAYNEGVAFRYIIGADDKEPREQIVKRDLSTIQFADNSVNVWSYVGERRPQGPELFQNMEGLRKYPLVTENTDGTWLSITEADLQNFDPFDLRFNKKRQEIQFQIGACDITTPFSTPWRVIMIADNPAQFVDSDLLVNLSPPPNGDFSWVKPGVSLWDWRAWGHQAKDGFTYRLEIESWKRFIDFAAEHDIPHLLLDANWYGDEFSTLSNPFEGGKAKQVKEALDYGKQKGVGLILYLNDKASVHFSIEEIIAAYAQWGAVGIKYGFMKGSDLEKVRKTERIVKACAEHKLMVNFHDHPIPPTGHERTWPHWNTREYIHAQSDARRSHSPGDFVHMAYLSPIAGPVDGNHGLFDLDNAMAQRPKVFAEVYSTPIAEAARTLILYSGLTVIPDSPDIYRQHAELFKFISAQKQPWKESRVLAGEFGEWITMMRQARDGTVLVATATDEQAREITLPLDFLEAGKTYTATLFADAETTHYKTNRTPYRVEHTTLTSTNTIHAQLAPGGGHCLMLTPAQEIK